MLQGSWGLASVRPDVGEPGARDADMAGHRPVDEPAGQVDGDVEVLKGHVVFDWDRAAELEGRVALGNPLRPTDLA